MNSGERIDYIRSLCQTSISAWSLFMADPVLNTVELIPVVRDSFPRCSATGSLNSLKSCGLGASGLLVNLK
ncbi:MAG: hypothetical protein BWX87_01245 [Bacteroidetes bacterium ADurb.Bin123]|jgi:hypothetical protein|nr:MAG: hypothetical protein BWX87_01245 [Bacteroidetes bacterium ADurb.Bin123]